MSWSWNTADGVECALEWRLPVKLWVRQLSLHETLSCVLWRIKTREEITKKVRAEVWERAKSFIVLHLANLLWYVLKDLFLTRFTKIPSLMYISICVQRCAITVSIYYFCVQYKTCLRFKELFSHAHAGGLLQFSHFVYLYIHLEIVHLDLFLLKNCQYGEHLYISSSLTNSRSDAMIRYCNEVHMTEVLWVIYSTRDLFVFPFLCSGFTSSLR